MEYGAHLPLIELDANTSSLTGLRAYADTAARLGYSFLSANDHLLYARPWLDGPTALAAVVDSAQGMTLATTVCLPVIRGPVWLSDPPPVSAYIITRIDVGDYDTWRALFDKDVPRAREKARTTRVLRMVDDPNHVFVYLEFASVEDAQEARGRLVASGVLDRFEDKHGPNVVVDADA